MPQIYEGKLDAKGLKFAIIVSRFNDLITNHMAEGALDVLKRHNASESDVDIIKVPGSFEIPFAVKTAADSSVYNAIIAIGVIIRGETPHFDYLASTVINNLSSLGLEYDIPVVSGVLTTETLEQAIERGGTKAGNRGGEAALSAIEMANLKRVLPKKK
ncbi:MAG: 6,7-dimethyl-8-ribityllumazine synthase [Deltaproteobacteria bacterium]|nr:6,7-dimethyl-8-ribityllumazine synthase [Deltaproteobacteria bacterium]